MTFLLDFIADAQGDTSVAALLRKMKVLGTFTQTPALRDWASLEINGYPADTPPPPYRGPIAIRPLGHFMGPFGSELQNVPIPSTTFPKKMRNGQLFSLVLTQGVAELETYSNADVTNFAWTADFVRMYNYMVEQKEVQRIVDSTYGLVNVQYSISSAHFRGVIDAIRNKALDLSLELYESAPHAGESDADIETTTAAQKTINNFINYNFPNADLSGSNNAFGSETFTQQSSLTHDASDH